METKFQLLNFKRYHFSFFAKSLMLFEPILCILYLYQHVTGKSNEFGFKNNHKNLIRWAKRPDNLFAILKNSLTSPNSKII